MKLQLLIRTFISVLLIQSVAHANNSETSCGEEPSKSQKIYNKKLKLQAEDMGLKLRAFFAEKAEMVALVSRAGGDLSDRQWAYPEKQKYTHTGIAVKDSATSKWKFVHELNDCAGPSSSIHEQGLAEFFMDDPFMFDVVVVIPSVELQKKILAVIEDKSVGKKGLARALHNSRYSNIANPYSTDYQNSNMWVLSVIAAAQSGAKTQTAALNYYKRNGFKPSQVKLSGLESMFGQLFTKNAKTEDHTDEENSSGWFKFVSSVSVNKYVKDNDKVLAEKTLCHRNGCDIRIKGTLIPAPQED